MLPSADEGGFALIEKMKLATKPQPKSLWPDTTPTEGNRFLSAEGRGALLAKEDREDTSHAATIPGHYIIFIDSGVIRIEGPGGGDGVEGQIDGRVISFSYRADPPYSLRCRGVNFAPGFSVQTQSNPVYLRLELVPAVGVVAGWERIVTGLYLKRPIARYPARAGTDRPASSSLPIVAAAPPASSTSENREKRGPSPIRSVDTRASYRVQEDYDGIETAAGGGGGRETGYLALNVGDFVRVTHGKIESGHCGNRFMTYVYGFRSCVAGGRGGEKQGGRGAGGIADADGDEVDEGDGEEQGWFPLSVLKPFE